MLKFFLNTNQEAYLRGLADEFGESTNSVRVELNRFVEAGLLVSKEDGRKKLYKANKSHKLFADLHNIVKKFIGIDQLVEQIVEKLGDVDLALVTGDYAKGHDSGIIDLVIVGNVDDGYLDLLVQKSERLIQRKIRTLTLSTSEFHSLKDKFEREKALVIWNKEEI